MKMRKVFERIAIILIVLLIVGTLEIFHSKYSLKSSSYTISLNTEKEKRAETAINSASLRILQITDLHNSVFGIKNKRLFSEIIEKSPDLIFITGDLVDSHKVADTKIATGVISKLTEIAPVYISLGNQELSLMEQGIDVISDYENCGATVLEYEYEDVEIKGQNFRIGGASGYCMPMAYAHETRRDNESEFLMEFQDTDVYKLLLCHMPLCWVNSYSLYDWNVDVVFSGHVHGGQVRIPFIGGLWAPDMGWFPGKLCGVYTTDEEGWKQSREKLLEFAKKQKYDTSYYEEHNKYHQSYLVLSRGLGNSDWLPRINNVPEIVVVDLASGSNE